MLILGVDENGLGPRLGPLVVTCVALEVETYDRARLARIGKRAGIDDSKATTAFGQMSVGESVSLALVERLSGEVATDVDALFAQVSLDGFVALRAPCPAGSVAQCWSQAIPLPAFGGSATEGHRLLDRLERAGVRFLRARSALTCASVYNDLLSTMGSKAVVDLSLFERLVLDTRSALGADVLAYCGMVGGIREYQQFFQHVKGAEATCETRMRRAYRVPDVGEMVFEVDADSKHTPVSLASMLGKYLRELSVLRQNRFYRSHDASLEEVSGYYDGRTRTFIDATRRLRTRLGIAESCFLRTK